MYFVFIYENRRMTPVEIVLRRGMGGRGKMIEGINLRYIVSTCVTTIMDPLYNYYMPINFLKGQQASARVEKIK
jgi:hypothetical protein